MDYEPNHSTIHRTYADISKTVKKRRRRREGEEKEAGTCAHVKTIELGRNERKEYLWNETRMHVKKMELKGREKKRREKKRKEKKRNDGSDQNQSTKLKLDFSVLKGDPHRSPRP
ncbi:LOW QUALITY PROTEIN: hypothetical protein V1477_011056 [Vespula maculifrons]|uniref:Uncharacterized protein n=1 Tax=Vespula maculifrons TaxID=7453 RepID=A0ABD2C3Q2_VESMC